MTPGLWVADRLKGTALLFVIGFPLLWGLLALVDLAGDAWWLWGFGLLFGVQLLMLVLYPRLILPLFNKLTPLPEGPLRERLFALADRTGFKASTIEVMDGSKRSGHANAFFTGFGRFRRIVLLDTLLNQLTEEETEAVLAHEVGHYRRGHVPKMLATSAALQFAGFFAVAWLAKSDWFNPGFGFQAGELAPAFLSRAGSRPSGSRRWGTGCRASTSSRRTLSRERRWAVLRRWCRPCASSRARVW
jgi:STE24 endopeptidase